MFLEKFLKFLMYLFLALPVIIVIRILRPFVLIRFGSLISTRIGHYAANTELYLCERDAGLQPRRTFDIFFNDKIICNYQLKKMWGRTKLLRIWELSRYLYGANRFLPGYQRHIIITPVRDTYNLLERIPAHLSFTSEEEKKGDSELKRMGIPEGTKFVCFHARDSKYLDAMFPKEKWHYHNYRDSNIDRYLPAAEEVVRRGYYLIRMGAIVEKPLTINTTHIIDYAMNFRNEFMDIYLCATCHFFISSGSGIDSVSSVFRRPIVYVNFIPLEHAYSWNSRDLFIPKKLWLRKESRFMTFQEILEQGVGRFHRTPQYEQADIEVIENTPGEIRDVATEMDERLKGSWQTTEEDEELQQRFWALFKKSELHGVIRARIGRDFLRLNKNLLE